MKRIYICLILSILAAPGPLYGQAAQFLTVPTDARTLSMGSTGVVASADAFSIYNNNSAVTFSDLKAALAASYTMWQPGTSGSNLANLSGFFKMGKRGAFLLGSRFSLYSPYDMTNDQGSSTGTYRPMEISFDLGYAFKISESFSAGVTLRYVLSKIGPDASGGAFAADLGLTYNKRNVSIGLSATNLGSIINYGYGPYTLPAQIRLGAGYKFHIGEKHLLSAAAQTGYLINNSGITAGMGLEYMFNGIASVRIGGHYGDPEKGIPPHISTGIGFSFRGLILNAAFLVGQKDSPVSNSLSVGLEWMF